ncbi:hypothetical protein N7454_010211 [Penicillium verhagenii]|nr:hypothetical protein N7454_010211 [Penicillium verhagenii]
MAAPVDAKLLRQTKFPPEFSRKVDMNKVNIEVMKKSVTLPRIVIATCSVLIALRGCRWISGRISEILGNEDDVVIALCFNLIEGIRYPDIKSIQIQLTGFLDKDTPKFCKDLWSLCLSGQENPQGVPKELLEAKKLELIQEKLEAQKAAEAARQQRDEEAARERELGDIRNRERGNRGNRGDRGPGQRGPGGGRSRDDHFDRRRSRSPRNRSRDRYRETPSRRDFDSYVPSSSNRRRRTRSPSRSRSRSRSPISPRRSTSREPRNRRDRSPDRPRRRSRSPSRSYDRPISPDSRNRGGTRRSPNYGDRYNSPRYQDPRSPVFRRDERPWRGFGPGVSPSYPMHNRPNHSHQHPPPPPHPNWAYYHRYRYHPYRRRHPPRYDSYHPRYAMDPNRGRPGPG